MARKQREATTTFHEALRERDLLEELERIEHRVEAEKMEADRAAKEAQYAKSLSASAAGIAQDARERLEEQEVSGGWSIW